MFLSRLLLNPRNPGVQQDVAHSYELHRTLMRGVDGASTSERLLFRLEPEGDLEGFVVLVQTVQAPDWQSLVTSDYLLRADGPKNFELAFEPAQRLRFRLLANPVKKVREEGKKHAVRIPLIRAAYPEAARAEQPGLRGYLDWLHRQADRHGFRVLRVQDAPDASRSRPQQRRAYSKAQIPHFGVRFDGVLRVTDPTKLEEAIRRGIGPAKAFGFGLLSLAPA